METTTQPQTCTPDEARRMILAATAPDNLTVGGWLDLSGTAITALPDNLTVGDWLDLSGTAIRPLYVDFRGYRLDRAGRRYISGCRNFTAEQALAHWGSPDYPDRARGDAYCAAIRAEEARLAECAKEGGE